MDYGIKGRRAIIMGGSSNLGKACAAALAGEGADLLLFARGKEALEKAAQEWKKGAHTEFERNYPRHVHYSFLGDCFELELDTNILTIDDIFYIFRS